MAGGGGGGRQDRQQLREQQEHLLARRRASSLTNGATTSAEATLATRTGEGEGEEEEEEEVEEEEEEVFKDSDVVDVVGEEAPPTPASQLCDRCRCFSAVESQRRRSKTNRPTRGNGYCAFELAGLPKQERGGQKEEEESSA